MNCLPDQSGVCYRTDLDARAYDEAIRDLQDAKKQLTNPGSNCTVCHDSGHTAESCHHNPLVMARRAVAAARVWRCFHCDEVFTNATKAQEHFGYRLSQERPACVITETSTEKRDCPY